MRKFLKYLYAAIVVVAACVACTVWIPSMELARKIEVSDAVNEEQTILDVGRGITVRQAFVPEYDEIDTLKVCLDSLLLDKQNWNLLVSVKDASDNSIYRKKIPGNTLKDYGWHEVVSRLSLEEGKVYYLEIKNEAIAEGSVRFAVTDIGGLCFKLVYREPMEQKGYMPYYLLVVILAVILLVRVFRKYE